MSDPWIVRPFILTNDSIKETDPERVVSVHMLEPKPNPYVYGYGNKIPTSYGIIYRNRSGRRMYRVWVMCYSNSGSAWINVHGEVVFVDIETEYKIEKMRDDYYNQEAGK